MLFFESRCRRSRSWSHSFFSFLDGLMVSIILCGLMCTRWYSVTMYCTLAERWLLFSIICDGMTVTLLYGCHKIVPATQNECFGGVYMTVTSIGNLLLTLTRHHRCHHPFYEQYRETERARDTNNDNNNTKTITISDFDLLNQSNPKRIQRKKTTTTTKKIVSDGGVCTLWRVCMCV